MHLISLKGYNKNLPPAHIFVCVPASECEYLCVYMVLCVCTYEGKPKVLLKSRWTPASAPLLPHSARHFLTESNGVGEHALPSVNPCELFPVTFLPFISLGMASESICSIVLPGNE